MNPPEPDLRQRLSAPATSPEQRSSIAMRKRQTQAAEYHGRAADASALAAASPLALVREKHEVAAARWRELAALSERTALLGKSSGGPKRG